MEALISNETVFQYISIYFLVISAYFNQFLSFKYRAAFLRILIISVNRMGLAM